MCVVSNIGDGFGKDYWPKEYPLTFPNPITPDNPFPDKINESEVEKLRREVRELRELLMAGKRFDTATGRSDCQMDSKVYAIQSVASLAGVDMGNLF